VSASELYERRGREAGHEVEDWLQAEAELTSEIIMSSAGEAVKKNPEPTVTSTGKTKAKQVKSRDHRRRSFSLRWDFLSS
jgi:hypothetical protein